MTPVSDGEREIARSHARCIVSIISNINQHEILNRLRDTGRTDLIHFAGAMHCDPAAYRTIELYLADPTAPLHVLTARRLGLTARQVDEAHASCDPAAAARLSTDYYGPDGWPAPGVPDVVVQPDGTITQSMLRPGATNEI